MLTGGKLADIFGRRRIFVVGLVIFTARLARLRARAERGRPDRRARRPGRRRGDDEPGDALDHHRDLPAAAARHGDRHLGRRLGAGARDRPARRRPDHRAHRLELDLLHQRPDRDRSASSSARWSSTSRATPRTSSGSTCPAWSPRRSASSRSPTALIEANNYGWTSTRIVGCSRSPSSRSVASSLLELRQRLPMLDLLAVPQPHLHRREHRDAARRARDVRRLLLHLALHPERPRLLPDRRPARSSCR